MEEESKKVDTTLDSFADSGVEIPQSHWVIQENIWFICSMAKQVHNQEWTLNDVKEFLESRGYKRETVNRFVHAVSLQLKEKAGSTTPREEHTTSTSPPGEQKTRKPKRSEGALTPEEVEKIKDPDARRFAKEYLDKTEASSGEADSTSPTNTVGNTTAKETGSTMKKDHPGKKAKRRARASKSKAAGNP